MCWKDRWIPHAHIYVPHDCFLNTCFLFSRRVNINNDYKNKYMNINNSYIKKYMDINNRNIQKYMDINNKYIKKSIGTSTKAT